MKNPCKYQITIWPRSSDSFYMVSYYIKWVNTSGTYSMFLVPYEQEAPPRSIVKKSRFLWREIRRRKK